MSRGKVVLGLSGGVDSSISAALLLEKGYEVIGVTLKTWSLVPKRYTHAHLVAEKLGIEWKLVDVSAEFKEIVVDEFIKGYQMGLTPNPCVICNPNVKFKALLKVAEELGADKVATGHYARVGYDETYSRFFIAKSKDTRKDQSYMLYRLTQEILERLTLPLQDYTKEEVRKLAERYGLADLHEPNESFDLCFAGPLGIRGFMRKMLKGKLQRGPILNLRGEVVGEHQGIPFYTLGQRRGLKVALGEPSYVVKICPEKNAIVVGPKELLEARGLTLRDVVWGLLPPQNVGRNFRGYITLRLHSELIEAEVEVLDSGKLKVTLDKPTWLVTPGQSAVIYDELGRILVGGIIESFKPVRSYPLPC